MAEWTDFDEYVAWYAWARTALHGDNLACHAAAAAALQALGMNDDREAAARAARHAAYNIATRLQIRSTYGPSHRYMEWFLWAHDNLRLPDERCHEAAALAIRTIENGGTSRGAAEAATRLILPPDAPTSPAVASGLSEAQKPVAAPTPTVSDSTPVLARTAPTGPAAVPSSPSRRPSRAARWTIGIILTLTVGGAVALSLTKQAWWLVPAFYMIGFVLFITGMASPNDTPWLPGGSWARHGTAALGGVAFGLGMVMLGTFSPAPASASFGAGGTYFLLGCIAIILAAQVIGEPIRHRMSTTTGKHGTSPAQLAHVTQLMVIYFVSIFIGLAIGTMVALEVFRLFVTLPDPGPYVGT